MNDTHPPPIGKDVVSTILTYLLVLLFTPNDMFVIIPLPYRMSVDPW